MQGNANWLRLEEKLAAQLTDEVARWVQLDFMQKVTAAKNVAVKNTSPQKDKMPTHPKTTKTQKTKNHNTPTIYTGTNIIPSSAFKSDV